MNMDIGTYEKDGNLLSRFNQKEYDLCDESARSITQKFFETRGCTVCENDGKFAGNVDYSASDLKIVKNSQIWYVETEIKKGQTNWDYVKEGVHFPIRKSKQVEKHTKIIFAMISDYYPEILLVQGNFFRLAIEHNKKYGYAGFKSMSDSDNFIMPDHRCHVVRKGARGRGIGDFIEIPYRYISVYNVNTGELIHKAEKYGT